MKEFARTLSQLEPTLRSIEDANRDIERDWPGVVEPRRAAVLLILHDDPGGPYVVLTRRPRSLRHHANQISFPGGKWERTDASLLQSALRETWEEIGVKSQRLLVIGALDLVYVAASNHLVTPFVAVHDGLAVATRTSLEVTEVIHIPIALLLDPHNVKTEQWELQGSPRLVTFYSFNGVMVWGATARILFALARLMGALQDSIPSPGQVRPL